MDSNTKTMVRMLSEHELALKELYETYAVTVPSLGDFWFKLAQDEQLHSDWLEALLVELGPDNVRDLCRWPQAAAVESSLKYIRTQITRARQGEVTPVGALSIAKDLENALLEKEFFKVADEISPEVRMVAGRLVTATNGHWRAVVEALDAAKQAAPCP